MSKSIFIDRRLNGHGKSIPNRRRFILRSKDVLKRSAKKSLPDRSITDTSDQSVIIPHDGINEPHFTFDKSDGWDDYVIPGNKEFIVGDTIPKQKQQGQGQGSGSGGGSGDGNQDEFSFVLSYDEFINLIFDDMELPDLIKQSKKNAWSYENRRAGYTPVGVPTNLNIERSAISSIGRRIAFTAGRKRELAELEAKLEDLVADGIDRDEILARIEELKRQIAVVPFFDNVDLKYNNFVKSPKPITNAVIFMMMDVSGSMGEREKFLSKKFFLLFHLFLTREYKKVEIVFVRHHDTAYECDEETFFTGRDSGGTVVSTGYQVIKDAIDARFPVADWNIYIAQASDGDNYPNDNVECEKLLAHLIPISQYFAYVEIVSEYRKAAVSQGFAVGESDLWGMMQNVSETYPNANAKKLDHESQVWDVLLDLFKKDQSK